MEFTSQEKDLLVKLLGKQVKKMEKVAEKALKDGENHIAIAAQKQKQELDTLLTKIL